MIFETIDIFLFDRTLAYALDSLEHKRTKRQRDIVIPLMIFLWQHIIIYIDWKSGEEFHARRQGLPAKGSFSDAIAILCMWLCEKKLLKEGQALDLAVQMYSRFVDDLYRPLVSRGKGCKYIF